MYEHNFTFATVRVPGTWSTVSATTALDLFCWWISAAEHPDEQSHPFSLPDQHPKLNRRSRRAVQSQSAAILWALRPLNEVKSLPGWEGPLPSKHYSGYLDVGLKTGDTKDIHIHYWLSESEGSPDTDPVVFWMNGGPGGSSLIGGLTENGASSNQVVIQSVSHSVS